MKQIYTLLMLLIATSTYAQAPADSVGIWADHSEKLERIDKITHQKIKGTGGLGSALSFGVSKIKAKLEFKGATSNHIFEGKAKFRMYFGNPPLQQIQSLYMFTKNYSVKDFEVAQFEVKKNTRLLTGVSTSILGSQVGVSTSDNINVEYNEIRDGVYEVAVSGKPGEYCIMFAANGTGGFGGVFDFTIKYLLMSSYYASTAKSKHNNG